MKRISMILLIAIVGCSVYGAFIHTSAMPARPETEGSSLEKNVTSSSRAETPEVETSPKGTEPEQDAGVQTTEAEGETAGETEESTGAVSEGETEKGTEEIPEPETMTSAEKSTEEVSEGETTHKAEEETGKIPEGETAIETEKKTEGTLEGEQTKVDGSQQEGLVAEEKGSGGDKECVYQVSFPTSTTAYLDPGNISGSGQIFSDAYKVENYGNTDVAIKIKNIDIYYSSTEDLYVLSENEIKDNSSYVKRMDIDMVWKNEAGDTVKVLHVEEGEPDEYVMLLKAAQYDENGTFSGLAEGGTGSFCFEGTLNSNASIVWEDGEIIAHFEYEIFDADSVGIEFSGRV